MKIQNAFNDFYNEFKDWTKEEILQRTFDIILESSDKDRQLEAYENMRKELIKEFNFYETTEWGIKGYEILEKFRNILNKVGGSDE